MGRGWRHVALDRLDRDQLVVGLLVGERGVELALPLGVVGEADARPGGPRGLQLEHVGGQVVDRLLDLPLLPAPRPAAELRQPRPRLAPAHVLLHQVDLRARHVELRPLLELEHQVLFDLLFLLQQRHAAIAGDAVADVHHQVPFAQLEEAVDGPAQPPRRGAPQVGPMEQLARC